MVNPFAHGGGPAPLSSGNLFMKILDLTKLLVACAPIEFFFTPSQSTLKYGSENYPWVRGLTKVCDICTAYTGIFLEPHHDLWLLDIHIAL